MREIVHPGYDFAPSNVPQVDDCVLENETEPVIRVGAEPFTSYYPVEWCYWVKHVIDPSRSLARPVCQLLERPRDNYSKWPTSDILRCLLVDLGFDLHRPTKEDNIAFQTIFPRGTGELMVNTCMGYSQFIPRCPTAVRVLNNPFFYSKPNVSERRLVEIAEVDGLHFALDRTTFLPTPHTLADEIVLLNRHEGIDADAVRVRLTMCITETMADWGLVPTQKARTEEGR